MKALHHFFVRVPKRFEDTIEAGGQELYLDTKWNEFENRKMEAEVLAVPEKYDTGVQVGDTLYFHHHVVMEQIYDLGEDLFLVNYEPEGGYGNHSIAIEDKDGNIHMLGDWCFVAPPPEQEEETSASGIILTLKEEPELEGELLTLPTDSEWIGTKPGDLVGYTKNSEYEMELTDGSKVYRMRTTELVYVKEA